jgi:hypothetical protein
MRLDTFRALLMMAVGGVYADLDFEALKPLDPLLADRRCVIGKEPHEHAEQLYHLDWLPGSAFLASAPGHPLWGHYVECIFRGEPNRTSPLYATGPVMLRRAIETYPGDRSEITILEPGILYPMPNLRNRNLVLSGRWASGGDNETASGFPGAFAVHRWQASWLPEKVRQRPGTRSGDDTAVPDGPPAGAAALPAPPSVDTIIERIVSLRALSDYLVLCRDSTGNSAISIKKATRGLFGDDILVFPEQYSRPVYSTSELNRITRTIIECGFDQVVLSGFPPFYAEVVAQLKCRDPRLTVKALSHGAMGGFMADGVSRRNFRVLMDLCRNGCIDLIGFNKRDLAETVRALFGVNTVQYYLYTEHYPVEKVRRPSRMGPDIGVLAGNELRKNVPAQVTAALLRENSTVHLLEGNDVNCLPGRERIEVHPFLPDPAAFAGLLAGMDLNLYVTFSESWGLVITESLIQGVPCLAGNSSGVFDFSDELRTGLVVDEADNPMAIYRKILEALENRDRLMASGIEYVHRLNELAVKSRDVFLSL